MMDDNERSAISEALVFFKWAILVLVIIYSGNELTGVI